MDNKHIQKEKRDPFLDDDNPFHFKILGMAGDSIYFYPHGARTVTALKSGSLSPGQLMRLAGRKVWAEFYGNNDGKI